MHYITATIRLHTAHDKYSTIPFDTPHSETTGAQQQHRLHFAAFLSNPCFSQPFVAIRLRILDAQTKRKEKTKDIKKETRKCNPRDYGHVS